MSTSRSPVNERKDYERAYVNSEPMVVALVGNQNCGKTTLFNQLTGSNQHVGNFPGVTVEQKAGEVRGRADVTLVDLPGIYSLRPYSAEEKVTRDFLINSRPDAIINIIDATNIERNLYLSLQIIELNIPMVLALNMMDEVVGSGGSVDCKKLGEELGIPAVPISAAKREGLEELMEQTVYAAAHKVRPARLDFCAGALHRCIHATTHIIEDHAQILGVPARFAATAMVDGDEAIAKELGLNENELDMINHGVAEMEHELGTDRNAALADMRYTFIEKLCKKFVSKPQESREHIRSVRIDNVLTDRYLAIPLFLAIMLLIFWLTFDVIGSFLSDILSAGIDMLTAAVDSALTIFGINPVVHSMIIDGAFAGVGSVLSFLPIIVTLFFFLSMFEDSGYMARVAFVMDKLLRKIGLSGRSIVPMLIGFGCTVPAIMATRTLSSERDRKITILLTPFMSCSAKVPIYAMFAAAFFREHQFLVMAGLYIGGIIVGIVCGLLLKETMYKGNPVPFVMELPNYRMPSLKSIILLMWDKAKDFLTRAFTVIFVATMIIWFLQTFNYQLNVVENSEYSLLGTLGRFIGPVFAPAGFNDWRVSTALITGLTAKEAVVSTLAVLTGASGAALDSALEAMFTPLTAISFLVFTLLYTPCVAAVAAINREMRSARSAFGVVVLQCGIAWIMSTLVYQVGRLLGL